jgi:hypothetical protein
MVVKMVVRPIAKLSEMLAQVQAVHRHGRINAVDDCRRGPAFVQQVGHITT